jgi:hypothetical protein
LRKPERRFGADAAAAALAGQSPDHTADEAILAGLQHQDEAVAPVFAQADRAARLVNENDIEC